MPTTPAAPAASCPRPIRSPIAKLGTCAAILECGHVVVFGLTRLPSNVKTLACTECTSAARRAALKLHADAVHGRVAERTAERACDLFALTGAVPA